MFGGNGFLGSATVERLIETGNDVTVVNRGNLYWDVKERIFPKVRSIICDREQNFSSCSDLASFVDSVTLFDVVIDFRFVLCVVSYCSSLTVLVCRSKFIILYYNYIILFHISFIYLSLSIIIYRCYTGSHLIRTYCKCDCYHLCFV